MHGARSGAPTGPANGAWRHGSRTKDLEQARREVTLLVKLANDGLNAVTG